MLDNLTLGPNSIHRFGAKPSGRILVVAKKNIALYASHGYELEDDWYGDTVLMRAPHRNVLSKDAATTLGP